MSVVIYHIKNQLDGRRYIGRTTNFSNRKSTHLSNLRHGAHSNSPLQKAFNLHGEDCFVFETLHDCEDETQAVELEASVIDRAYEGLYNILRGSAGTTTASFTEDARRKISEAQLGEKNHMFGKTGRDCHMFGKKRTPETRQNMINNRWVCDECGLNTTPGALSIHQKHTGHQGRTKPI